MGKTNESGREVDFGKMQTDISWIRKIGGFFVVACLGGFGWLVNNHIPHEITHEDTDLRGLIGTKADDSAVVAMTTSLNDLKDELRRLPADWLKSTFQGPETKSPSLVAAHFQQGNAFMSKAMFSFFPAKPDLLVEAKMEIGPVLKRSDLGPQVQEEGKASLAYLNSYVDFSKAIIAGAPVTRDQAQLSDRSPTQSGIIAGISFANKTSEPYIPFIAIGPGVSVIISHVSATGVDQPLDGIAWNGPKYDATNVSWVDVTFKDSEIEYQGRFLSLANVKFERCTFKVTNFVPFEDEGQPWMAARHEYFEKQRVAQSVIEKLKNAKGPVSMIINN